jgi:hypothetical protein
MIIKDKNKLKTKCSPVSIKEGEEIAVRLLHELRNSENKGIPEGCLSFPNKKVRTKRNVSIQVRADNHESTLSFSADSKEVNDAFECVCVQHEIDHLDGITMFDREFKQEPLVRGKNAPLKIGRNDKVTITKGSESKVLKYKKAEPLLEDGWALN